MPPSLLSLLTLTLAQYGDASVTMPVLPGGMLLFIRRCSTVCAFTKACASEALIVCLLLVVLYTFRVPQPPGISLHGCVRLIAVRNIDKACGFACSVSITTNQVWRCALQALLVSVCLGADTVAPRQMCQPMSFAELLTKSLNTADSACWVAASPMSDLSVHVSALAAEVISIMQYACPPPSMPSPAIG